MKKLLLFVSLLAIGFAVNAQSVADDLIKVNTENHNLGKIKHNVPVSFTVDIKNISSKPVVVENTYASCGCTTPEKITEPIAPGATVKLKVQFNAAALGPISKDVFVKLAGVEQPKTIHISGEVVE